MQVVEISIRKVLMLAKYSRFRGAPHLLVQLVGRQQLFIRAFQRGGKFKFLSNIVSGKTSEPGALSTRTSSDNKSFGKKKKKTFSKQLAKE